MLSAEGGTRTPTPGRALPPQDSVSTSSTTSAVNSLLAVTSFLPSFIKTSSKMLKKIKVKYNSSYMEKQEKIQFIFFKVLVLL